MAIHLVVVPALLAWSGIRSPIVRPSPFQGNTGSVVLVLMGHSLPTPASKAQEEIQLIQEIQKVAEENPPHSLPVTEPVPVPQERVVPQSMAKAKEVPVGLIAKPSHAVENERRSAVSSTASTGERPKTVSSTVAEVRPQSTDSIVNAPGQSGMDAQSVSTKDVDLYLAAVRQRIERCKEYPALARRMREEGEVIFRISIDREGALKSIEGISSHSSSMLAAAGRRAIEKAAPFGKPPANWPAELSLRIPIRFSLHSPRNAR